MVKYEEKNGLSKQPFLFLLANLGYEYKSFIYTTFYKILY